MASRLKSVHELQKFSSVRIQNIFRAYPMMVFSWKKISTKDFILSMTKYMSAESKL